MKTLKSLTEAIIYAIIAFGVIIHPNKSDKDGQIMLLIMVSLAIFINLYCKFAIENNS